MATNCTCDTFPGNLTVLGNLGIGTATPQTNLNVVGQNASLRVGSTVEAGLDYNDGSGDLYVGGSNGQDGDLFVKDSGGTVRVEIRAESGISIDRTDSQSPGNELFFQDNGQIRSSDDNHRLIFDRENNILELREFGSIVLSPGASSGQRTQVMTLLANGNVGIGTTNPYQQLDITGNLHCNGILVSSDILINGALQNSLAQTLVDTGGCYYAS
ncbi:MAG: hypothetical protein ACRDIY_23115 [Chloroflexota bacterium]